MQSRKYSKQCYLCKWGSRLTTRSILYNFLEKLSKRNKYVRVYFSNSISLTIDLCRLLKISNKTYSNLSISKLGFIFSQTFYSIIGSRAKTKTRISIQ